MAGCSICPTNASLGYILLGWLLGVGDVQCRQWWKRPQGSVQDSSGENGTGLQLSSLNPKVGGHICLPRWRLGWLTEGHTGQ